MPASTPSKTEKPVVTSERLIEWAKIAVIPVAIAIIGYFFTTWQKQRDDIESNVRLYTQLVTQREQSDSQLRTEMFKAVIEKFVSGAKTGDPHDLVLKLELLAYNFHESLDLGPLFKEVVRVIDQNKNMSADERKQLRKRLDAAAGAIVYQQVSALALKGRQLAANVNPEDIKNASADSYLIDEQAAESAPKSDGTSRPAAKRIADPTNLPRQDLRIRLQALTMDLSRQQVEVRLLVQRHDDGEAVVDRHFFVSRYDFPMLDNTRLPNGERCSVVLTDFYIDSRGSKADKELNSSANLVVVVFPATSASLKERLEYDELLHNMLRNRNIYSSGETRTN